MLTLLIAGAMALAPLPASVQSETPLALTGMPTLHGTLRVPDTDTRAVAVILPGSGPTDQDGNSLNNGTPLQVRAATYRLLAEGLAGQGVATLRIDKRGIGQSLLAGGDERSLRFDAFISDARAWAVEAATRTGRPCAWLIGHSEGALVALGAVREPDDRICGLVLLAPAGRPAATVIAQQLVGLPEPLKAQAMAGLADLVAGRETANIPGLESLFRPSVQPYLISWFALDPAGLAAAYSGPVMIARGTTDIQVAAADLDALTAARPDATVARFEGVNHVLKIAPADRAGNIATYSDPDLPLAPGVAEAVGEFILGHSPER